mgnify:CR=1 FL=1
MLFRGFPLARLVPVLLVATGAVVVASPRGECGHLDVLPFLSSGKILTGGHSDLDDITVESVSVFGYDFGEDPNDPWFIGDPGFNNGSAFTTAFPNSGALPSLTVLSLTVAAGSYGPLHYWDGNGAVNFAPVGQGVEINLNKGSGNLRIGANTLSGTLAVGQTNASGRIHQHIQSSIGSGGSGQSFTTLGAPDGLYAMGILLSSGGFSSDPIYIVYNVNMSETIHDAGIAWFETHVVPEPSTTTLSAAGLLLVAGFRHARRGLSRRSRN